MHKTAQQLIREAYEAANGLPPVSAALVKELASRLDISMAATSQACDERSAAINTITATRVNSGCPEGVDVQDWVKQLAAENVGLKGALTGSAYINFIKANGWNASASTVNGKFVNFADPEVDFGSMVFAHAKKLVDDIKTPATDRIYAGIKADGVELFAKEMHADISVDDAREFAQQLREVSANG
ncbi:hypothetical protein NGC34_00290 [Klebsiella michiganensis]|uniref:hypothetical protein n=1 Tax=Klebsiella michiganensis TaxID=1134687 RepID=UPI002DB68DB8|nr:hypothetical protein [Klebsiella michiganensis]MEB7611777.1 hypothetical protein [Klebsiella michiganensis]